MTLKIIAPVLIASTMLLGACDRGDSVAVPTPSRTEDGAADRGAVELRSPIVVSPEAEAAAKEKIAGAAGAIGDAVSDSVVTAKVKGVLMSMNDLEGARVSVSTEKGIVTLSGTLPDAVQVARAVEIARGVEGVRDIENRLKTVS